MRNQSKDLRISGSNINYQPRKERPFYGKWKGLVGALLLFAGICILIHYLMYFQTTVEVEDWLHRKSIVQDAALQRQRMVGIFIGIAASVVGAVLVSLQPKRR